jgi:hypothetical protein
MRRFSLISAAALLATSVVGLGCPEERVLYGVPNDVPIARALIDVGDMGVELRLGYVPVGTTASLDGTRSLDPDDASDDALEYQWTFEAWPDGSTVAETGFTIPEENAETDVLESAFATFVPDVLGTYRISLVVVDKDDAASRPAVVVVQAIPASALEVRLDWDDTRADLDLHLVAPDGTYFDPLSDCFSWYPNPDWGSTELALDNPSLGSDDDGEGEGPYLERIFLEQPMDGRYRVYVHYYSDHHVATGGANPVPATPTVSIRTFDGVVVDGVTASPMLHEEGRGDVWLVGELTWPSLSWSLLDQSYTHDELGGPPYNNQP